ncbi:MAG: hypothetical protein INR65_08960 [Gluconacetobacter diazotrophicus]|nr:hypothetical protein [Gluconacetobacter diazotrophicus]
MPVAGYEDGWSAPMDGSVFLANIEWRDPATADAPLRDRPVRWGPVTESLREALGAPAVCFDLLDQSLGAEFWRGECWIHSWRPAPAGS